MKTFPSFVAGTLLACLALLSQAAPADEGYGPKNKQVIACVRKALKGDKIDYRVVTQQSDTYAAASKGDILVDQTPVVIAYVLSADEISPLIQCGVKNGYKVSPRSGGHHFENWSSLTGTLVIDTSHFNQVKLSQDGSTATISAGAKLGQVYEVLERGGKTINGGICPTVGIGGYLGSGGYNMQQRLYGLAVDYVNSIKLVLADGRTVKASKTENPDLYWAARGGGTYGFIVESEFQTRVIPRSAMIYANFTGPLRNEALQKFNDWAAKQEGAFNSQFNLYSNNANILGWYIGKSVEELKAIVKSSGLEDIKGATIKITGNCSTKNSRNFWLYTQTECGDDAEAEKLYDTWYNVVPDNFGPVPGAVTQFSFEPNAPALPDRPKATAWPRIALINKTYFVRKSQPLKKEDIKYITDKSGALPEELKFWAEITTFNISKPTNSAFAWQGEAQYLLRTMVEKVADPKVMAQGQKFMDDLEAYLIPKIGTASYSGYTDADISSNPYQAYWGNNVCRLSKVKKQYDPKNLFSNPFSIPPENPKGVNCY